MARGGLSSGMPHREYCHMSKSRPITEEELQAIKRSVEVARARFVTVLDPFTTPPNIFKLVMRSALRGRTNREKTELEVFLLDHWAEHKDGIPPLFSLNPNALFRFCRDRLKLEDLTREALIKTRQRLGLKPFKRQKRDAIYRGGRWIFPQVDKK